MTPTLPRRSFLAFLALGATPLAGCGSDPIPTPADQPPVASATAALRVEGMT